MIYLISIWSMLVSYVVVIEFWDLLLRAIYVICAFALMVGGVIRLVRL